MDEVKKEGENWVVKTNNGTTFLTPNVIIAGGVGSFEPRKFPVKECEKFENKSLFYSVKNKKIFEGKTVTIFGGGDSALDWAVEFSKNSKVNLVHRRDDFRGAQATVDKVKQLAKDGKLNLFTKFQMTAIKGENNLESTCRRLKKIKKIKKCIIQSLIISQKNIFIFITLFFGYFC